MTPRAPFVQGDLPSALQTAKQTQPGSRPLNMSNEVKFLRELLATKISGPFWCEGITNASVDRSVATLPIKVRRATLRSRPCLVRVPFRKLQRPAMMRCQKLKHSISEWGHIPRNGVRNSHVR